MNRVFEKSHRLFIMILCFYLLTKIHTFNLRRFEQSFDRVNLWKGNAFFSHSFHQILFVPLLNKSILNFTIKRFSVLTPAFVGFVFFSKLQFQKLTKFMKLLVSSDSNDNILTILCFVYTIRRYIWVLISHSLVFDPTIKPRTCHIAKWVKIRFQKRCVDFLPNSSSFLIDDSSHYALQQMHACQNISHSISNFERWALGIPSAVHQSTHSLNSQVKSSLILPLWFLWKTLYWSVDHLGIQGL